MQDFRKLHAWRAAHALTLAVYRATEGFPSSEGYGLTSQLRRSAASVGANLSEGCGCASPANKRRFMHIAHASASEVLNHLLLARDLGLLDEKTSTELERETFLVRRAVRHLIDRIDATLEEKRGWRG